MTDTELKLTRIESLCHACLELDAKTFRAPWKVGQYESGNFAIRSPYPAEIVAAESDSEEAAEFIVQARDLCPRLAKSTLTAIAALQAALEFAKPAMKDHLLKTLTEIASHFDV